MIKTQGLTHIHLMVADLDRSIGFYQKVFGMRELFREGPDMVFLRTPGSEDMITLHRRHEGEETGAMGSIAHFQNVVSVVRTLFAVESFPSAAIGSRTFRSIVVTSIWLSLR